MRAAFSDSLLRIAAGDPRVLLLTGDHGYSLFDEFRRRFPERYINAGIAEQNMVGMAAGLARAGFRPFVYGLSAFIPIRVVEQIKLDIAHDKLPVVLIGDGAGFVYSSLGSSHQSTEDIACTRAVPQLAVLSPGDRFELVMSMNQAYAMKAPVYLRLGKSDRGDVHGGPVASPPGALLPVFSGVDGDVTFIATGSMLRLARDLAKADFPAASVWSAPSLKPIDVAQVEEICRRSRILVTLEEHSIYGGMGSIVAEIASSTSPVPVLRIGVSDRFSEHSGTYEYLLTEHGLDAATVRRRISDFIAAH